MTASMTGLTGVMGTAHRLFRTPGAIWRMLQGLNGTGNRGGKQQQTQGQHSQPGRESLLSSSARHAQFPVEVRRVGRYLAMQSMIHTSLRQSVTLNGQPFR